MQALVQAYVNALLSAMNVSPLSATLTFKKCKNEVGVVMEKWLKNHVTR